MWKKLLADLQLSILILVGGMSSVIIAAFSVYRFLNGNVKVGLLDATIFDGHLAPEDGTQTMHHAAL